MRITIIIALFLDGLDFKRFLKISFKLCIRILFETIANPMVRCILINKIYRAARISSTYNLFTELSRPKKYLFIPIFSQ